MSVCRHCPASEGKLQPGNIQQAAWEGCSGSCTRAEDQGASRQLRAESSSPCSGPAGGNAAVLHYGSRNIAALSLGQTASAATKPKQSAALCSQEGFMADRRHHLSCPRMSHSSCRLPDAASPLLQDLCSRCLGPSRPQDGRCPETSSLPDSPNTLHLPRPVPVRAELSTASAITSLHQPLCNTSNCTCDDSERFSLRLSWLVILLELPAGPHHAIGV